MMTTAHSTWHGAAWSQTHSSASPASECRTAGCSGTSWHSQTYPDRQVKIIGKVCYTPLERREVLISLPKAVSLAGRWWYHYCLWRMASAIYMPDLRLHGITHTHSWHTLSHHTHSLITHTHAWHTLTHDTHSLITHTHSWHTHSWHTHSWHTLTHDTPAPLWLFSEFGAVYKYSDLLTYLTSQLMLVPNLYCLVTAL